MSYVFISEPPINPDDDTRPILPAASEWELVLTCEANPFASGHQIRFNMTTDEQLAHHLFDEVKAGYARGGYVFEQVSADEWKGTHFQTTEVIRLQLIQPTYS